METAKKFTIGIIFFIVLTIGFVSKYENKLHLFDFKGKRVP